MPFESLCAARFFFLSDECFIEKRETTQSGWKVVVEVLPLWSLIDLLAPCKHILTWIDFHSWHWNTVKSLLDTYYKRLYRYFVSSLISSRQHRDTSMFFRRQVGLKSRFLLLSNPTMWYWSFKRTLLIVKSCMGGGFACHDLNMMLHLYPLCDQSFPALVRRRWVASSLLDLSRQQDPYQLLPWCRCSVVACSTSLRIRWKAYQSSQKSSMWSPPIYQDLADSVAGSSNPHVGTS